jgi:hypothetical protein
LYDTGGGTPRSFDGRPVPSNQKYGFAIEETVVCNNKIACVRWNTQQAQNTFVAPELPHGTHKIKWFITDGCGNNKEYEYTFTVKDCKAPTVLCAGGLSVSMQANGTVELFSADFLQFTEDNCTPSDQIRIGIRKYGIGSGFPFNNSPSDGVTYDCTDVGFHCVEIWALDAAGNADYCEVFLVIQDNLGNCPTADHINATGVLKTEQNEGVEEGTVTVAGTSTFSPPYAFLDLTDSLGLYAVTNSSTFTIAPEKDDNPLNGVTTYDLVLISKHILGIEPLNSPYKMIAADAMVSQNGEDFVGVKIGDVNGSVIANATMPSSERSTGIALFDVQEQNVVAGVSFDVTFKSVKQLLGFQFTLLLNGLEVADVRESEYVFAGNFGLVFQDAATVSVDYSNGFAGGSQ